MLNQSVQVWNGLRRSDPAHVPDLSGADLEARDLSGADLRLADLRGAYLNGAKLERADLRRADLRRAHLTYADLSDADLAHADLRGADLHGAELRGANLDGALVAGTILDPVCWTRPLLELWNQASPAQREQLVQALERKTTLHRRWTDGLSRSPGSDSVRTRGSHRRFHLRLGYLWHQRRDGIGSPQNGRWKMRQWARLAAPINSLA